MLARRNEKLGRVKASEVAVITGNHVRGEGVALQPRTLASFLANAGELGGYAGLPPDLDLSCGEADTAVSIRFQTVFLPVPDERRGALEFTPEMYNYQTRSADDPQNLLLLATTQGTAVQADGPGAQRVYHHAVDGGGKVHQYWLEAERSSHAVGGAQVETAEEAADAAARGKATSAVIGIKAMGTRFNVLMTIQVPLKRDASPVRGQSGVDKCFFEFEEASAGCAPPMMEQCCAAMASASMSKEANCYPEEESAPVARSRGIMKRSAPPPVGVANAARVSRGSHAGEFSKLALRKPPERDTDQHVTVTCVMYATVAGGVPSAADVAAAIEDMESLYAACDASGRLASTTFDFMKGELTAGQVGQIAGKLATQPYQPPVGAAGIVKDADVFPGH